MHIMIDGGETFPFLRFPPFYSKAVIALKLFLLDGSGAPCFNVCSLVNLMSNFVP